LEIHGDPRLLRIPPLGTTTAPSPHRPLSRSIMKLTDFLIFMPTVNFMIDGARGWAAG
jgi:hypothetical protein